MSVCQATLAWSDYRTDEYLYLYWDFAPPVTLRTRIGGLGYGQVWTTDPAQPRCVALADRRECHDWRFGGDSTHQIELRALAEPDNALIRFQAELDGEILCGGAGQVVFPDVGVCSFGIHPSQVPRDGVVDVVAEFAGTGSAGTTGSGLSPTTSTLAPSPAGEWRMNVDPAPVGVCQSHAAYLEQITVALVGDGSVEVYGIAGSLRDPWVGSQVGDRIEFTGTKAESDGGVTTALFVLDYDPVADAMSGTERWEWTDGQLRCTGGTSVVAAER